MFYININVVRTMSTFYLKEKRQYSLFFCNNYNQHFFVVLLFYPSISTEFLTLMKKVAKTPLIVDVLNIQGVQRQLERLADLLGKIQKALGEYLERERASFPRFYFVGDEDLLEIIGNSKSIPKLQKHFKKMFAGVAAIVVNEDETLITGLSSKEGEEVKHIICLF